MAGGVLVYLLCGYVLNSLTLILIALVLVIMARSIVSEIVVMNIIGNSFYKEFIAETVMTVAFMLIANYMELLPGAAVYLVLLAAYCIIYKRDISLIIKQICSGVKKI